MDATFRPYEEDDFDATVFMELRKADKLECWASSGHSPADAISLSISLSKERYVIEMDDEIVGVFGLREYKMPGLIVGMPWLLSTDTLFSDKGVRLLFARKSREIVEAWAEYYPVMMNFVAAHNTEAIRWLEWLGFDVIYEPLILEDASIMFYRFTRST